MSEPLLRYPPVNRRWMEKLHRLQGEAKTFATMPGDNEPLPGRDWLQRVSDALQEARIIIGRLELERAGNGGLTDMAKRGGRSGIYMLVNAPIELPTLPNFLRLTNGSTLPVESLNDDQLKALGESWTEALIHHAEVRRRSEKGD